MHDNILHLLGNMMFLWVFGNAVCAKFGNLQYLGLYLLFGLFAAISHTIFIGTQAVGASGAINGIVGAFLILYPLNSISVFIWFWGPRYFNMSSMWLIFYWLVWDIYGAVNGHGQVAYIAHLGGFFTGALMACIFLHLKYITMEDDELSLIQFIKNRRNY
jgi:membrane associated rhomboid family serine protease